MWKDLTLKEKAEIMKMSVANGVTDINDIQQLYDGSVGHRFDDGSRIITIGQFPEGFVNEYADTPISTPSSKSRTTLKEAFNDPAWRELHVDANSVPYLTDYLLRQEQPNSIYGDRPKKDFADSFNEWKEEHPTLNTIANYTPFVSTVMDGLELYTDPSWGNLGWFAADLASDIFSLGLAKGVTTGGKLINKVLKGSKTITGRSRYIDWDKTSKIPLGDIIEGGDKIEKYGKQTFYQGTDLFQNHLQNTIQDNDVELSPNVDVYKKALGGHLYKNAGPMWSNNPASMIEHFEGFRESPYRDGTAWSVGYGQYKNGYGANLDWDALLSGKKKLTRNEAHQQVLRTITDLKKKLKNTLGEKLYNSLTPGQLMGYLDTGYQRPASMISAAKVHKNKGAAAAASVLGVNGFADRNAARRAAFTGNWDNYTERGNREYTPNKSTSDNYVRQMLNNYEAPAFQPITLNSANVTSPWMDYLSKISQQSPVSFNTPIGPTGTKSSIITSKPISFNVSSFADNTRPEVMENITQLPQYQSILNGTLFNDPYLLFRNA